MKASDTFQVFEYQDWRQAVHAWRGGRRERTLRWLSDKTGFALGHISEILSTTRRRAPNPVFVGLMGTLMALTPVGRRYFEALVRADLANSEKVRRRLGRDFVGADRFEAEERAAWDEIRTISTLLGSRDDGAAEGLIDRWLAGVIYEAAELEPPADAEALAERILPPVTAGEVQEALTWLREAQLITVGEGRLQRARNVILWFGAEDSEEERRNKMRAAHQAALRHFLWALDPEQVPREARSYKLIFQALPEDLLPEVNARLDELLAWIHDQARARPPDGAVYAVGVQLVPVTKRLKR